MNLNLISIRSKILQNKIKNLISSVKFHKKIKYPQTKIQYPQ